jgi:hypothetical protein
LLVLKFEVRLDDLRSRRFPLIVAFGGLANVQERVAPCFGAFDLGRKSKAAGLTLRASGSAETRATCKCPCESACDLPSDCI